MNHDKLHKDFCHTRQNKERAQGYTKLTFKDIANRVGIRRETLWRIIIKKDNPSNTTMDRLCKWIGTKPEDYK